MRSSRRRLGFLLAAAALSALLGCGYSFQSDSGPIVLPEGVRTLAIYKVENPSLEVWLEPSIRSKLRDEITRRGQVVWADSSKADALLYVVVQSFVLTSDVKSSKDQTLKYSAKLKMQANIKDRLSGRTLWRSGLIDMTQPYFLDQQAQAEQMTVELAVRELVDRMSQNY
ncbi:MAG: LPS assembly lipoprotein LptE [Desulfovibrionaceae bacterium]